MRCLKFELFSPCATFKTPFSLKGIETYPLPPYSTIIGLIYTALGRKWNGESFSISIQGDYETLFRDYMRFRKYNTKGRVLEMLPLEVPRLFRLRCIVHVVGEERLLEEFKKGLEKPASYLFISGGEHPVLVRYPRILEVVKQEVDIEIKHSAYVPEERGSYLWSRGIYFRIPYFCKYEEGEKVFNWKGVYYIPKGSDYSGEAFMDEEGEILWV